MNWLRVLLLFTFLYIFSFANSFANGYMLVDEEFIDEMIQKHDFDRDYLESIFSTVSIQERALQIYAPKPKKSENITQKPKKKVYYWPKYKKIFITPPKVRAGALFVKKHIKALKRAYEKYGVDPYVIAAIIGIESHYGENTGKYRVLDTLSTLAFIPNRRNKFFKKELEEFLVFTQKTSFDPLKIKGSYAGAIGLGQFMPSSYNFFAVDFDMDGFSDPWDSEDAIGSIAKYLKENGWVKDGEIAVRAGYPGKRFKKLRTGYSRFYYLNKLRKYGIYPKKPVRNSKKAALIKLENEKFDELWLGFKNFYVITRYNHSAYYAMAVYLLAQKIKNISH